MMLCNSDHHVSNVAPIISPGVICGGILEVKVYLTFRNLYLAFLLIIHHQQLSAWSSSDGNSHKRKKHKKIPARAPPTKIPEFLRTVGSLYPKQYLTQSGNFPASWKGTYCCQLFSRVRFGNQVSQKLRTRTVSVGFRAATTDEKRDIFQSKINEAVNHLSRERALASLFANFVFMERLRAGSARFLNLSVTAGAQI